MSNPFTVHPNAVNETYTAHLAFALKFGFKMTLGGLAAMIHALFPFLFIRTSSNICDELQVMRSESSARAKQMPATTNATSASSASSTITPPHTF